ncbi:MAG TPA: hypothetical protein VK172_08990 [Lentimicrobium sp.]|nr:hypothetical protein [Lentimicrobium sp.]
MKRLFAVLSVLTLFAGCGDKENNHEQKPVEPFDVITLECSSVTMYKASLNGIALYNSKNITYQLRPDISFCYSRLPDPDINDSIVLRAMVMSTGSDFADSSEVSAIIDQLNPGTTIYYRIYARTKDWIRYGEVKTFTTEINSFKPIVDSVYKIGSDSVWIAWRFLTSLNHGAVTYGNEILFKTKP